MGGKQSKVTKAAPPVPKATPAPKPAPLLFGVLPPIAVTMAAILVCIGGIVAGLTFLPAVRSVGSWLPTPNNANKRQFEVFALAYSVFWISCFAVVIVCEMWRWFGEWEYLCLCLGLDLPLLLQPLLFPLPAERCLPILQRYSFKANLWIAVFAFVGSYWYTHYFYSVLEARYTFPSHRLNDVPIALYFAAHFYFVTYHTLSNMILRKIETRFSMGWKRSLLFWAAVFGFSYFTAFMETLTISSFPYYSFRDRDMAYTVGSAFYGIYFIVSFPAFYRMDEVVSSRSPPYSTYQVMMDACGSSMIVLCLLDFGRLFANVPLEISGRAIYTYGKK